MALAFACVSALMVPVSLCGVHEQKLLGRTSFGEYVGATWELMRSQAFFFVVLWQFLNPAIQSAGTSASTSSSSATRNLSTPLRRRGTTGTSRRPPRPTSRSSGRASARCRSRS